MNEEKPPNLEPDDSVIGEDWRDNQSLLSGGYYGHTSGQIQAIASMEIAKTLRRIERLLEQRSSVAIAYEEAICSSARREADPFQRGYVHEIDGARLETDEEFRERIKNKGGNK